MMNNLNPLRFARIFALTSRTIPELTPPHNPLSLVNGTNKVRLTVYYVTLFYK